MLDSLPPEILFFTFLKLPSKTLILCTAVSKSWRSLITDPLFILSHLHHSNATTHGGGDRLRLLRRCYNTGERYSLHFDSESLEIYKELKLLPQVNWNGNFKLVGSSNGLLCLLGLNVFFWNPSIQRFLPVPWPIDDVFSVYGTPFKYALGFGFDSCVNDFKLVRLVYVEGDPPLYDYELPPRVEMYELSTRSWRQIRDGAPNYEILKSQWTQVYMNQSVHWIAFTRNRRGFRSVILRFHMNGEFFSTISLPRCLVNESPQNLKVAVLGGALCVLQCGWYPFGNRFVSSVWMLRNYEMLDSWTRILSVDPSQGLGMALDCRENGEMLMTSRNGDLVSYNPVSQIVKGLGIRGAHDSFFLDTFVESLALLNEGKRIVKQDYEDWNE